MNSSKLFRLDIYDIVKSFFITILSGSLMAIYPILENGTVPNNDDWKKIILTGFCAGISYLIKNVFTNSKNELLKKEK